LHHDRCLATDDDIADVHSYSMAGS
jgi:hypothetical protein